MEYFKTKMPNLDKILEGVGMERMLCSMAIWNLLRPFGTFYGQLAIKWQFGIYSPILVYCVKKNLATLTQTRVTQGLGLTSLEPVLMRLSRFKRRHFGTQRLISS
jgi:hypothetical protein